MIGQLSTMICRLIVRCFTFAHRWLLSLLSVRVTQRVYVMQFADDMNRKVSERADVVRELKKTIVEAFNTAVKPSQEILKCCPAEPLNLENDARFGFPVTGF